MSERLTPSAVTGLIKTSGLQFGPMALFGDDHAAGKMIAKEIFHGGGHGGSGLAGYRANAKLSIKV